MSDAPARIWTQALGYNEVSTACFTAHSTSPEPPDDDFKEYIRADIHEAHIKELEAQLKKAVEALRWCAGSPDFNEGGSAYEGWNKICAPIAYPLEPPKENE